MPMKSIMQKITNRVIPKINEYLTIPAVKTGLKIFLILLLFLWTYNLATRRFRQQHLALKVGDIAPYDITVANDVEYVDEYETQKKIERVTARISPIFKLRLDIAEEKKIDVDTLFDEIEKMENENEEFEKMVKIIKKKTRLRKDVIEIILKYHRLNNFRIKTKNIIDYIYKRGITSMSRDSIKRLSRTGYITKIHFTSTGEEISIKSSINDIFYIDNIPIKAIVKKIYPRLRWDKSNALSKFVKVFLTPNLFYDRIRTEEKIKERIKMVEPVKKRLKKGQVIVRYGEEITERQFKKLSELRRYTVQSNITSIRGYFFLILLLFLLASILLFIYGDKWVKQEKYFLFLITFLFVMETLNYFFPKATRFIPVRIENSFFIPIGGIAMLLTSLSAPPVAYILTIFIGTITTFFIGLEFLDFVIILLVGCFTVFISSKIKKRLFSWYLGMIIAFLYFIIILTIAQINNYTHQQFINSILIGVLNGIASVIISTGFLPLFEHIFNLLTDYRLLELSDLNLPIMKRLLIEAPGTYHHSIMVANLAETAALNIGANPLLARVGAYYHDIGKIENPEYFIENQLNGDNSKHDKIKPSISSSIVKSHLKYGVELAKRLRLPSEIIDIIKQHHGTTVIKYFYKKALEKVPEDEKTDIIANYQYEGPKPQSKEAAIVMLADSVEAASRALQKPSHPRIVSLVKEIINTRFLEGELDECQLTLRDLNKIAQSFIQVLSGRFHSRIEYPEKEEIERLEKNGNKHRK